MKIPSLRRIFSSDFKGEYKALMDQLGILFNGGLEPIYTAMSNNLTFEDNFSATVVDVKIAVDSSGVPIQATQFKLAPTQKTFSGIIVINAQGIDDPTILPESGVYVSGALNGNLVNIRNVKGLLPEVTYKIKIICLA